jgi:hypothetical protein
LRAQEVDNKASLQAQDKAAQTQYAQTLKACATKLAPAQCQRQAKLDFNTAKHAISVKRNSLDQQIKRDKQSKQNAETANNVATAKQGKAPDGSPLARPPLAKPAPKNKTTPAPMSKPSAVKNLAPKKSLSKKGAPPKGVHSGGALSAQPTPEQRRDNVAKFAANEQAVAARKNQVTQKQRKRQAKDDARRASGFRVDKP